MNFLLICLTLLVNTNPGYSSSYDDIKSLGADCSPYDTCSRPRTPEGDDILEQNCECKSSCVRYGTCCIDSPYNLQAANNSGIGSPPTHPETCELIQGSGTFVFVQTKCKPNWDHDQTTRSLCENVLQSQSNPVSNTYVTSLVTSTTYKNYFCALCNDDNNDLIFWEIGFSIPMMREVNLRNFSDEKIAQHLIYNNFTDRWGIRVIRKDDEYVLAPDFSNETEQEAERHLPVFISFRYPLGLPDPTKKCAPGVISHCHRDWTDIEIENKCHSYTAMIYTGEIDFESNYFETHERSRNVHCAICNFLADKFFFCEDSRRTPALPELSFAIFFNVNLSTDDRPSKMIQCSRGESYDQFIKQCFPNACVRVGYVVRNGKCVPP